MRVTKRRTIVLLLLSALLVGLVFVPRKYIWLYLSRKTDPRPPVADLLRDPEASKNPELLLAEANRLAWLFNWPKAEPLYIRAEELFKQRGDARDEIWLSGLDLAPKSKGHIRSIMHILFNWAMKWELIDLDKMNPMKLVRVEGSSKRLRQPRTLTVKEFRLLLERLEEPICTMCIVAACLGLRASELAGLQWGDFDWGGRQVHIQRGFVIGYVDEVKTPNSNRSLPVHRALATLLLEYKKETAPDAKDTDWLFPSPYGTGRPRWPWTIQRTHLLPAGIRAGLGRIGWHTFRQYSGFLIIPGRLNLAPLIHMTM